MRFGLACLVLAAGVLAEEPVHVLEGEHYRLHAEGDAASAEEMLSVLEAAWQEYRRYFGGKPRIKKGEKLVVRYYLGRENWAKAIQAAGSAVPAKGGGYYWPVTKEVFLYRQPTRYYSRVLLLHEAGHQFHYLARTRNKSPAAYWYTEGVAEFVSWHHWDGVNLEIGVQPNVSLKDYAAQALDEAQAEDFDFAALVEGKGTPSRALCWALYRWLATGGEDDKPLKRFKAFYRKMDGGVMPGTIFKKSFGTPKQVFPEFLAWLEANQQPWEYVFNEWEGLGAGRMHGFSKDRLTISRLKQPVTFLQATLELEKGQTGWNGGVVLHYEDPRNYSFALINWGGFVQIARYIDGRLKTMERGPVPAMEQGTTYTIQLFRRGGKVYMSIGKVGFGPWELPGSHFGLAVQRSDLKFRDITYK